MAKRSEQGAPDSTGSLKGRTHSPPLLSDWSFHGHDCGCPHPVSSPSPREIIGGGVVFWMRVPPKSSWDRLSEVLWVLIARAGDSRKLPAGRGPNPITVTSGAAAGQLPGTFPCAVTQTFILLQNCPFLQPLSHIG